MSSFFKSQLIDREKNNIVFPELRRLRRLEIEKSKNEWNWQEKDFKIYPSGQWSLDCCVWEKIQDLPNSIEFPLVNFYKMKSGTSKHWEIQQDFLKSNLLYYPDGQITKQQKEKLDGQWPEVPFTCWISGISGRVDLVLKKNEEPILVEIKTISIQPDKWDEWKQKNLPKKEHFTQTLLCLNRMNFLKVYKQPIKRFGVVYLNLLIPSGEQDGEAEYWYDYTDELKDQVNLLIANITKERNFYMSGKESNCTYLGCKKHNGSN